MTTIEITDAASFKAAADLICGNAPGSEAEAGLEEKLGSVRSIIEAVRRRGDEAAFLKEPINTGLGDERALAVGEGNGDFARGEFRLVEGEFDDLLALPTSGMRFQTRRGLGRWSSSASRPPVL